MVTKSDNIVWCPAAGCSASIELPAHAGCRALAVECSCGASFCFGCKAMPHHEPASCAAWAAFVPELEPVKAIESQTVHKLAKVTLRTDHEPSRTERIGSEF